MAIQSRHRPLAAARISDHGVGTCAFSALDILQNTTGFPIANSAGCVTIFQQTLTPTTTDAALDPTSVTPDAWDEGGSWVDLYTLRASGRSQWGL